MVVRWWLSGCVWWCVWVVFRGERGISEMKSERGIFLSISPRSECLREGKSVCGVLLGCDPVFKGKKICNLKNFSKEESNQNFFVQL